MMGTNDFNSGEDVLGLYITLLSNYHNNVSSWDGRTDFYGMMSDTNHRTPNGYNFLHNPETDDMDIAYFVGTFELVGERCHFEGNCYNAHGMREYLDDYIPMEPFFFPDSELYQENL